MQSDKLRIAIIGCGNIAGPYARNLATYPQLDLVGFTDLDLSRAEALAEKHGGRAFPSIKVLLADPGVDLVVNLTIHHAHYAVTRQSLEAGKHVVSEKPLALTYVEARELVQLAEARGLRLGGTPFTFMGEAQQTAMRVVREGRLGTVRVAYADVNWGRIETWHPAPAPFYDVGPLYDVGVYPLMLLTAMFGPARQVSSYGRVIYPDRVTKGGEAFTIKTPDFAVTMVELASGTLLRLTTNFYVLNKASQQGVELHGDAGSLQLTSWYEPYGVVHFAPFGEPYVDVTPLQEPAPSVCWGMNVAEIADALRQGRPHRATGEHAAHVVEILEAAKTSMGEGRPVAVESSFAAPEPMGWAR
jgi:predicted dehydrogenase